MILRTSQNIGVWIFMLFVVVSLATVAAPVVFFPLPVRFTSAWTYVPTSGQYKQLRIDAAGSRPRSSDVIEAASVTLTLFTLTSEHKSLALTYDGDPTTFARNSCSPELLQGWMSTQGVDVASDAVQAELHELSAEILNAALGYSGPSPELKALKPIL